MDTDKPMKAPSLWLPITDRRTLAALGKLAEEVNELGGIISRCIIQGLDEADPDTGKVNRVALEEEIADVDALSSVVARELDLDMDAMYVRSGRKQMHKMQRLAMITEHEKKDRVDDT